MNEALRQDWSFDGAASTVRFSLSFCGSITMCFVILRSQE